MIHIMKTKMFWLAGILITAAAVSPVVRAQSGGTSSSWREGLYLEFGGGTSTIPGGDITLDGIEWEGEFNNGTLFMVTLGKDWTDNWATELDWFYRTNDLDTLTAGNTVLTGGDLASTNLYLSVTYTFDGILGSAWRPYAGLGLGAMQEIDIDINDLPGEEFQTKWETGFQWLVGIKWEYADNWAGFLEGRAVSGGTQTLDSSLDGRPLEIGYDGWSLIAGLKWSF